MESWALNLEKIPLFDRSTTVLYLLLYSGYHLMREIDSLWFRDTPWFEYPLLTLPFIGDVSVRRLAYMALFGMVGFILSSWLINDRVYSIAALALGVSLGFLLSKPPKAFYPERVFLTALTRPRRIRRTFTKPVIERVEVEKVINVRLSREEPLKVYGVLRDHNGNPIPNARVELVVDDVTVGETVTDDYGRYTLYTKVPEGHHIISVRYQGVEVLKQKVLVKYTMR